MGGSFYSFPCSILSIGKDCKTLKRYPDIPTTSRRISLRSMDSFQGHTSKSLSSWYRSLALSLNLYDHVNPATRRTINQSASGKLHDKNAEESCALLEDLALYDNESWNDPRDFAKPVKTISLPQDVSSTFDCRLIELENQVQRLMKAHLAPKQPVQVNKISSSCEICSGPHDTQFCMENPEHGNREAIGSLSNLSKTTLVTPIIRHGKVTQTLGLVSNFMASQDARLSKFEAYFKQQGEMTNKINAVLKAITNRITGELPSDTVKNPKLSPISPVMFACSYQMEDPQCSSHPLNSINAIKTCSKETNHSQKNQLKMIIEPETQQEEEPKQTLESKFKDLHLNLPVLKVLAHAPIYNAILDKYAESLQMGKNGSTFIQGEMPERIKDPRLFTLPYRVGDSKPFDTLADLGSCVNLIPLYLFKKLKIELLEETGHVFILADGT
ncbi:hypothetical protein Tco_1439070 [Tanacetum coccineum]